MSALRERDGFDGELDDAVSALDGFPVHRESRRRLAACLAAGDASTDDLAAVIGADVGLAMATVRVACRAPLDGTAEPVGVRAAVEALGASGVERAANGTAAFGPFDPHPDWRDEPELLRLHGVAVHRAAERLLAVTRTAEPDLVLTAALLHDVGKLALVCAFEDYPDRIDEAAPPEERVERERSAFGADHARVGAELARRWRLPERLAATIERHHDADGAAEAGESAALVRLADMLAHYERQAPVDLDAMVALAGTLGLDRDAVGRLLYELPYPLRGPDAVAPCPLSARELDAVRALADGRAQRRIAAEEGVSPRTLSKLLRAACEKLGVSDRAQAVLVSRQRGWI